MSRRFILTAAVLVAIVVFCAIAPAYAETTQMLGARHPEISPDGTKVLFSYNGDLWIAPIGGGGATRVTDNVGYERNGVWSRDGRRIAFSSNRYGNYDVFVMPAAGGEPVQLTFSDAQDYATGWNETGGILFYSYRGFRGYQLFELAETGGMPVALTDDDADTSYACYAPGGDVIYTRGSAEWYRKGYFGSANFELWHLNRSSNKNTQITNYKGNDGWPATADGKSVYFISERSGKTDVYRTSISGGEPVQLTNASSAGAAFPSVSADGKTLVYEDGGRLFKMSAAGGDASEIIVYVSSDEKRNSVFKDSINYTDEYALSPNGKYVAFTARGDIFVTYTEDAFQPGTEPDRDLSKAVRVTDSPARDWQIAWHPDSDKLAFASDRDNADLDIYIADLRNMNIDRLTSSPEDDAWPRFSPDGKYLGYYRGGGELVSLEVKAHKPAVIDKGEVQWGPYSGGFEYSPDSRWIAYWKFIDGFNADIFIAEAGGGKPVNVLRHPDWIWNFQWLPDGSGIVFMSDRVDDNWGIFKLDFVTKENIFTKGFILDSAGGESEEGENGGKENHEGGEEAPEIEIDYERIWERVTRLSAHGGASTMPVSSIDSSWVYYMSDASGEMDLWAASIDGLEAYPLGINMPMDQLQMSPGGDKLYFLAPWGGVGFVRVNGPQVQGMGNVPFSAAMKIDRPAELMQMYSECWRLLKNYFYDPNLHGARKDWDAIFKRYVPLVEQAATPEEFNYIVARLIGEVKGSHLGIWGGTSFNGVPSYTGFLGLDFDLTFDGPGLRVKKVLYDGPCYRKESRVEPGEILLSVNGASVNSKTNIFALLDDKPNDQVDLVIKGRSGERTVSIIPIDAGAQYQLSYQAWVEERRIMTEKLSGGRIGYLHVQQMDWASFEKFKHDLFGLNYDKEAVIVDVRFNGGGWTSYYILELLARKAFGWSRGRHSDWMGAPAMRWEKPAVCLINSSCYSDSEIFPYGFKQLGIGKLIGEATNGSVIGTLEYPLVDGSSFRLPVDGWYTYDRRNMEVSGPAGIEGIQPDIFVSNLPDDVRNGKDAQLERAVEELLRQIGRS